MPTIHPNGCYFRYEMTAVGADLMFTHGDIEGLEY